MVQYPVLPTDDVPVVYVDIDDVGMALRVRLDDKVLWAVAADPDQEGWAPMTATPSLACNNQIVGWSTDAERVDAADRIAALLGANSEWDSAAQYLEWIAEILSAAGYPTPGERVNLARYRALADEFGIEHDGEPDDERMEGDEADCSCGIGLVWTGDEWQHDAAPWRWGDDHEPNPSL